MGIYPSSSFFFFFFFFFFPLQLDKKLTNFFRIFLISVNSKFDQLSKFTIYLSNIYISAIHLKFNPKKKNLPSSSHFLASVSLLNLNFLLKTIFIPFSLIFRISSAFFFSLLSILFISLFMLLCIFTISFFISVSCSFNSLINFLSSSQPSL